MMPMSRSAGEPAYSNAPELRTPLATLGEELMIYQVAELWAQIEQRTREIGDAGATGNARIDCAQLREFDAAGLQLLLFSARHLESLGLALTLTGLNDTLRARLGDLDPGGHFYLQALEAA